MVTDSPYAEQVRSGALRALKPNFQIPTGQERGHHREPASAGGPKPETLNPKPET